MMDTRSRRTVALAVLAVMVAVLGALSGPTRAAAATSGCAQPHWVGSWESAPGDGLGGTSGSLGEEDVPGGGGGDVTMLFGGTFRLVLTPHLGGSMIRVHLSDRFGLHPLTVVSATIGVVSSGAALVPGSVKALSFGGQPSVTIPAGQDVVSDPLAMTVSAFQNLAVSVYVPSPNNGGLTEHYTARQTSFFAPRTATGDLAADPDGAPFTVQTTTRPLLDGLDVLAPGDVGAVVTLGDSLTDGYGGTPARSGRNPLGASENPIGVNLNGRWPDDLARRLSAANLPLSVLNAGISGNRILQYGSFDSSPIFAAFGPPALTRLNEDVLAQAAVSDVIVLEGINDIGDLPHASAAEVIAGLTQIVARIHAAGLPVQLGTLTPIGGATYDTAVAEAARTQVNAWIRSQRISDGVIDFDAAVRDPGDPSRLLPAFNSGDWLHPNPAGYQAMANAVDLSLLHGPACASASPAPMQLIVRPPSVTIRRPIVFRFTVRTQSNGRVQAVSGATVTFDRHRTESNSQGNASLRLRLTRPGTYRAFATAPGHLSAVTSVSAQL